MIFCLYTAKSFYLKDTVVSVNCFNYKMQVEYKSRRWLHCCKELYVWVSDEQLWKIASRMTSSGGKMEVREKKIPQFLCFTSIHFQWPTTLFSLQKESHFPLLLSTRFVRKLKRKGMKNISANACPLSNQVQWLQKPQDGTWFVPWFSQ